MNHQSPEQELLEIAQRALEYFRLNSEADEDCIEVEIADQLAVAIAKVKANG